MHISKAFTLLEMMIVLVIIGIGLISAAPKIGEQVSSGSDKQTAFFNELIKEHLAEARRLGTPVKFIGFKGSANIEKYDGKKVSIPDVRSVQTAFVNSNRTPGLEYHINVYPDGICDHFEIETDKHLSFESRPLLLTVRKVQK